MVTITKYVEISGFTDSAVSVDDGGVGSNILNDPGFDTISNVSANLVGSEASSPDFVSASGVATGLDQWGEFATNASSSTNGITTSDVTPAVAAAPAASAPITTSLLTAPDGSNDLMSGVAPVIAEGTTFEISSPYAGDVTFAGPTGTLLLDPSSSFYGTVMGYLGQDELDLADITFGANTTVSYTPADYAGGTLTVSDGVHTANIALLGQFTTSSFTIANDGNGGTLVTDPAATAQNLLSHSHS